MQEAADYPEHPVDVFVGASPAMRALHARTQGWESAPDRDACLAVLRTWARIVVEQRAGIDDPCLDAIDVFEGLLDRLGAGVIVLPAEPWKAGAAADLARVAARVEWRLLLREREEARRRADELAMERVA